MLPFAKDFSFFYATIYGGILIGLVFDIYRVLRTNFKIVKYCSLFFDVLFWILTTIVVFATINSVESFELRYYHFVALFIGFILYYNTISKFILTIMNKIILLLTNSFKKIVKYIVNISNNLYYVIIYSIHFLFDIIFYIPNMIFSSTKFVKRKARGKIKIKKRV